MGDEEERTYEEQLLLRGARIEVNYLADDEDEDGEGKWWAGTVTQVSRSRGVQVAFDEEPVTAAQYHANICAATEGSVWRREMLE